MPIPAARSARPDLAASRTGVLADRQQPDAGEQLLDRREQAHGGAVGHGRQLEPAGVSGRGESSCGVKSKRRGAAFPANDQRGWAAARFSVMASSATPDGAESHLYPLQTSASTPHCVVIVTGAAPAIWVTSTTTRGANVSGARHQGRDIDLAASGELNRADAHDRCPFADGIAQRAREVVDRGVIANPADVHAQAGPGRPATGRSRWGSHWTPTPPPPRRWTTARQAGPSPHSPRPPPRPTPPARRVAQPRPFAARPKSLLSAWSDRRRLAMLGHIGQEPGRSPPARCEVSAPSEAWFR